MARKSIKGYTEKNYYDNTRFRGITATTDPLNEGYFNHMVNFDIADTGQSVTPRKGFKTFKLDKSIPNNAVYFKDPSSDYYIFVWLYNDMWSAYKTNFIDESDVDVETTIESFEPLEKYAQIIYDHYQIQRNVLKAKVGDDIKYINFTYRANDTSYENVDYKGNTVTIDIVDTEDIGSIDTTQRNIASTRSIIPSPIQVRNDTVPYNKFPMIYIETPGYKYAINSVNTLDGVTILPYFELKEGSWGYAYEVISTFREQRYVSPVFTFENEHIDKDYNIPNAIKTLYPIDEDTYSNYSNYSNYYNSIDLNIGFFKTKRATESINLYVFKPSTFYKPDPKEDNITYKEYIESLFIHDVNENENENENDVTTFVSEFPTSMSLLKEYLYANDDLQFIITPFNSSTNSAYFSNIYWEFRENLLYASQVYDYIIEHNIEYINIQGYNYMQGIITTNNNALVNLFGAGDVAVLIKDKNVDLFYYMDPDSTTSWISKPYITYDNTINAIHLTYDVNYNKSLFTSTPILSAFFDANNDVYTYLKDQSYFKNGLNLTMYIFPTVTDYIFEAAYDVFDINMLISTNLVSSRQLVYSEHPTYYIETLENEPKGILGDTPFIVFDDRIVTWKNNIVYMSEMNSYYYFKYTGVYNFPERVVKALAYKDTVLVFTTQNLYCIYPYEYTETVQDGVDDEGNPKYVQQKVIAYASLPVLYNLMVDEKYADAIQVFNQMILFYSADGQLFMIKPTASIDSNTRFSIQYFNKSANDILANYDVYINKRLASYGLPEVSKDDINIRVEVTLNYIKIYYYTNNYTYILIYDVINNYYYTYDTQVVYNIQNFLKTEGYDTIVIESDDNLYFSSVHKNTKNVDLLYNSRTFPIEMELDTGVINLNNHLKKRFRTLHTTYKNIDADDLIYNLEVLVDEVPVYTMHDDIIEVVTNNYETVSKSNEVNLLEDNTVLFKFNDDSLNKIMNHRTNIVSIGKTIRLKTTFKSAGRFKLQGFGLVYKEHQI